jgi:NAD(P)-dependent dehydrogenase (short-subunit alcohol dehydrogenase family)
MGALDGRRIVVTGGSSGIGAGAVAAFVREGASVVAVGTDAERGERVAAGAQGPGSARFVACDVRDRAAVQALFAGVAEQLGGLDALVHAAGVRTESAPEAITDEELDLVLGTNVRGTIVVNQEAFGLLRDSEDARVLNFASGAALYPYPRAAHYSASKAAVIAWTRTVAHAWGPLGIRVNAVNAAVATPMFLRQRETMASAARAAYDADLAKRIPAGGTFGDLERDLLPVLVFLLTDGGRFINGQIVSVDGGMVPLR